MEAVILKSNSIADIELIVALARKLGIEISKLNESSKASLTSRFECTPAEHNFLNSKGLWKDRRINAKSLRDEAWKIQN